MCEDMDINAINAVRNALGEESIEEPERSEKTRINLYNWQLFYNDGKYSIEGTAEYYPGIGRDYLVTGTSKIISLTLENDILEVESVLQLFICPLKYMTVDPYPGASYDFLTTMRHLADDDDDMMKKIIAVSAESRIKKGGILLNFPTIENPKWEYSEPVEVDEDDLFKHVTALQVTGQDELKTRAKEDDSRILETVRRYDNSIYLEVSDADNPRKLAYHMGEESGLIEPMIHGGSFSDSILYTKHGGESDLHFEFRYFPRGLGDSMETYVWTDRINQAVIHNEGERTLQFDDHEIKPGETGVFERKSSKYAT